MRPLDRLREWLMRGTYEEAVQAIHIATLENNLKASEEALRKAVAEREAAEIVKQAYLDNVRVGDLELFGGKGGAS